MDLADLWIAQGQSVVVQFLDTITVVVDLSVVRDIILVVQATAEATVVRFFRIVQ